MSRLWLRVALWLGGLALVAAAILVGLALARQPSKINARPAGPDVTSRIVAPVPRTTVPPTGPSMPGHGAYVGAYVEPRLFTQDQDVAAVNRMQSRLGRKLAIVHTYSKWAATFPTASQQAFLNSVSVLLLSWAGTDTRSIVSGRQDSVIKQKALAIKATGKPIFLEWRWEMNRPDFRAQLHSPHEYIAAWDHIRAVFAQEHVHNVAWVWCPSSKGFGEVGRYGDGASFYPGNKEVDWLCVDAYPVDSGPRTSFAQLLHPFLAWASHIHKPVMIGETGVPRSYGARQRAIWLQGASQVIRGDRQVKALVYFDGDPAGAPRGRQYALDAGSPPLHAFRTLAREPYFNPVLPNKGKPSG
ncbi:MAG TPA: hypothetical protein VGI64_21885 [Streptosporangiaceae bacterium]